MQIPKWNPIRWRRWKTIHSMNVNSSAHLILVCPWKPWASLLNLEKIKKIKQYCRMMPDIECRTKEMDWINIVVLSSRATSACPKVSKIRWEGNYNVFTRWNIKYHKQISREIIKIGRLSSSGWWWCINLNEGSGIVMTFCKTGMKKVQIMLCFIQNAKK